MIDFLVIGGGIAGLSLAARLTSLGKVTVLEAEDATGYHASGRSAAMFEETYGSPSTIALNRASRDYHMTAHGGVLSPRGLMLVGTEADADAFSADMKSMEMEPISIDEARTILPILDPDVVTHVGYHSTAWDIDTDLLMQNFLRDIRTEDGEVLTKHPATQITRTAKGWRVQAADKVLEARILVNAAGAWADEIAILAGVAPLGIAPLRRSMARVAAPAGYDVSTWPMVFGPGESWYSKPDAGSLLVSPADETPVTPHDAWAEDLTLAEGIARYEAVMTEPVTRLQASWAGLRSFAPDRNLVIGFDPQEPAFFWQAGQGGYGFQTAPAAGQLGADVIGGRALNVSPQIYTLLDPARF